MYGSADIVDDRSGLAELWNTFAEAWLPGDQDDPNAVLLRVDVEHGEYWDTPGGKVASLIRFAKGTHRRHLRRGSRQRRCLTSATWTSPRSW